MKNSEISGIDLIEFEDRIAKDYEDGKIKNPIHLSGVGNEEELVKLFKKVNKEDWVFSTHRNHYHALLKSQDKKGTKKQIYKSSMHINSKKHKIFTSAIVGGNLPIALGVALAIKLRKEERKVYCFTGDMAAEMGIFHECFKYHHRHELPIKFIVERNKLGVLTPIDKVWTGISSWSGVKVIDYKRKWPHHGVGKWVNF